MARKKKKQKQRGADKGAGSARARRREQKKKAKQRTKMLQFSAAGVIVLAVAALVIWPKSVAAPVDAARLADDPVIGAVAAPVVITEFADFGCPACRSWHNAGIRERVLETYGDQVQFVWRDFPVITAQSPKAAEAGQCAYDQGKFWKYHDLVYESRAGLGVDALKFYAEETGLDTETFNSCLETGQHRATVEHDLNEARNLRLRGTPSFIVNGQTLPGPPRYEQLVAIIDEALN